MRNKASKKQLEAWKSGKYSNWPPKISKETLEAIKKAYPKQSL